MLTLRKTPLLTSLVAAGLLLISPVASDAADQNLVTIETVASFTTDRPVGNIAVGPNGRKFVSLHQFYGPAFATGELQDDGTITPYPTADWSAKWTDGAIGLNGVLGLNVDREGVLWLLDTHTADKPGRLIGWDTKSEQLHQLVYLTQPVIDANSFLNDLAIDRTNAAAYIADSAGAIIVVDLNTGQARRVLAGSTVTIPEDVDMVIDGRTIMLGDTPARIGINPITIDAANEWVYFGPMSGTAIYRVRTADLRDAALSDGEMLDRVERYGDKPLSDGSTVDEAGNVYITAVQDNAIGVTRRDGSYEVIYQDDSFSWPDGFATGADGFIYLTVNELHRSPVLNGGENGSQGLIKVIRFKPLAPVIQGR